MTNFEAYIRVEIDEYKTSVRRLKDAIVIVVMDGQGWNKTLIVAPKQCYGLFLLLWVIVQDIT